MNTMDNFDFTAVDNNEKEDSLNLVPDEGFTEEINPDQSKKFSCKMCDKVFKSKRSVKQHIVTSHKSMKRTAEQGSTQFAKKLHKKTFGKDDIEAFEEIAHGDTTLNETVAFCKDFLSGDNIEEATFNLDMSIEKLVVGDEAFHSTVVSEEDVDILSPDQDHSEVLMDAADEKVLEKTKLWSLEKKLKLKDIVINEKDNELKLAQLEITDLKEKVNSTNNELDLKQESLNIALSKSNALEEDKYKLQQKLMLYSATIKKIREENITATAESGYTEKESEVRKVIKEKNKKLTEAEARCKLLAQQLAEYEDLKEDNLDEKYKKLNDKLSAKAKDLKKSEKCLSQAEDRTKELLDIIGDKNKKISELENTNTRLKLMKNQSNEIIEKTSKSIYSAEKSNMNKERVELSSKSNGNGEIYNGSHERKASKKCQYENTGSCRRKDCNKYHPKKTCQPYSKLGSCPLESSCEHRHPFGVCHEWERFGSCRSYEVCRFKHPFEFQSRQQQQQLDPSLGSPRGLGGSQGQDALNQGSQQGGYHDMRGNRW